MHPGEYFIEPGEIEANVDRRVAKAVVKNTGDRPIQVGSHFHFFEVNQAMLFDRATAYGMRLNIAAGTAVRFEPGEEKEVMLVAFGGARRIFGHNGLVNGRLDDPSKEHDYGSAMAERSCDTALDCSRNARVDVIHDS